MFNIHDSQSCNNHKGTKMLQRKIIPTKRFLKCVKNTINDLKVQNYEDIKYLREIVRTNNVNLTSAMTLYEIIEIRKKNYHLIASLQDKESFKIVNKEHRDMEKFLNAHFISHLEIYGTRIFGHVSFREAV